MDSTSLEKILSDQLPVFTPKPGSSFDEAQQQRAEYETRIGELCVQCGSSAVFSSEEERCKTIELLMRFFNMANFTGEPGPRCEEEQAMLKGLRMKFGSEDSEFLGLGVKSTANFKEEQRAMRLGHEAADSSNQNQEAHMRTESMVQNSANKKLLLRSLSIDGEVINPCVRYASVLPLCMGLVSRPFSEKPHQNLLWRLRVLYRYQLCLEHRAHSLFTRLYETCKTLLDQWVAAPNDANDDEEQEPPTPTGNASGRQPEGEADAGMLLEIGIVLQYYHRSDDAGKCFFRAVKASGLHLAEEVMKGVRTRWQQDAHLQAVLVAKSSLAVPPLLEEMQNVQMPESIGSEKEGHDLLDRPRAHKDAAPEEDEEKGKPLHPIDHATLLALCTDIRNRNPHHGLVAHQMQIYTERLVIDDPKIWITRAMALLVRSRLEHQRSKVVERAHLQLAHFAEVVEPMANSDTMKTWHRCHSQYLYPLAWPTIWQIKAEYAANCFENNMFKTALEIFETVQDWPNIMECCKKLDRRRKAEFLAKDLLEQDPENPSLWVALGEATRDEKALWKAWELSGGKHAAAMRSLARLAMDREQYDKVIEYFDKSVEVNPIFGGDWFSLGYASMKLDNFDRACEAFTRVCQVETDNAYAWTNLGAMLLRKELKRPAFHAFSQALRNNRLSWKMWDNYFGVAVHLLEVSEATHALRTAMEIAGRKYNFDGEQLMKYVEVALRYVRKEIHATRNVLPEEEGSEYARTGKVTIGELTVEAHATARDTDGEDGADAGEDFEDMAIEPLLGELKLDNDDEAVRYKSEEREAAVKRAAEAARADFVGRVKKLFQQMASTYVENPIVFAACGTLFGALEGPMKEAEFRQKQVREAHAVNLWQHDNAKFEAAASSVIAFCSAVVDAAAELKEGVVTRPYEAATTEDDAPSMTTEEKTQHLAILAENAVRAADNNIAGSQDTKESHPLFRKVQASRMAANKVFVAMKKASAKK